MQLETEEEEDLTPWDECQYICSKCGDRVWGNDWCSPLRTCNDCAGYYKD